MKALVLSGGGSKGSYQAGVIRALSQHAGGFDIVTGISVGAINASAIAMFNKVEFDKAAAFLDEMWRSKLDIWKLRFPPYLSGLWNNSLGKNTGLRKLIDKHLDLEAIKNSDVKLSIGAVDLLTGTLRYFNNTNKSLKKAILASSSYPIAFPPEEIGTCLYTDGGVREIAPLRVAIDQGATDITIVLTAPPESKEVITKDEINSVPKLAARVVELMSTEVLTNDIELCRRYNECRNICLDKDYIKLTIYRPSRPLHNSLDFDQKAMIKQITMGYEETKQKLQ